MEGRARPDRLLLRTALGSLCVLSLLLAIFGLHLSAISSDPQGISQQGPLTAADIPQLQPLYAASWTPYRSLDWSPDGRIIAVGGALVAGVGLVDADTGQLARQIAVPAEVNVVRWSPDGQFLAVGTGSDLSNAGGWVYLYDARGFLERSWQAHSDMVGGMAWSPNGSWLATTANVRYAIWVVASGQLVRRDVNASAYGENVDWSPDGTRIALESSGGPAVYDAISGARLWAVNSGDWDERSVAWSHAGDAIASSNSDGCLDVFSRDGQYLWGYAVPYPTPTTVTGPFTCTSAIWSRRPAWNRDDSLIAVPTTAGLRVFDAASRTLLRNLAFPVRVGPPPSVTSVYGYGDSLDMDAEWSPSGNVLASTASTSATSLRLWGIPHRISPAYGTAFNLVFVAGVPAFLDTMFVDLLLRPAGTFDAWSRRRPAVSSGTVLLVFLFFVACLQQAEWSVEQRVTGALVVPPASWFVGNLLLSVGLAIPPVLAAWAVFRRVVGLARNPGESAAQPAAAGVLGWALLPVVWTYSLGLVAVDTVVALAGSVDVLAATIVVSAAGGLGLLLALSGLSGLRGVSSGRALASLGAAAGASVGSGLAMFGVLVLTLRAFPGLLAGDFAMYGIAVGFGFGLVPWLAALALLLVLAPGYALGAAPPKALIPLFARLRGTDIADQKTRRQVLAYLRDHPGTHFHGLLRALPVGSGSLHYHLFVLEREGYVVARRDGMYRRFFASPSGLRAVPSVRSAPPKDA